MRNNSCVRKGGQCVTFALETAGFLLGFCGFAARVVKGEEVEREITIFEFCTITATRSVGLIDRDKRLLSIRSIPIICKQEW